MLYSVCGKYVTLALNLLFGKENPRPEFPVCDRLLKHLRNRPDHGGVRFTGSNSLSGGLFNLGERKASLVVYIRPAIIPDFGGGWRREAEGGRLHQSQDAPAPQPFASAVCSCIGRNGHSFCQRNNYAHVILPSHLAGWRQSAAETTRHEGRLPTLRGPPFPLQCLRLPDLVGSQHGFQLSTLLPDEQVVGSHYLATIPLDFFFCQPESQV